MPSHRNHRRSCWRSCRSRGSASRDSRCGTRLTASPAPLAFLDSIAPGSLASWELGSSVTHLPNVRETQERSDHWRLAESLEDYGEERSGGQLPTLCDSCNRVARGRILISLRPPQLSLRQQSPSHSCFKEKERGPRPPRHASAPTHPNRPMKPMNSMIMPTKGRLKKTRRLMSAMSYEQVQPEEV